MSSRITNYKELLAEEQRLLAQLKIQKMRIDADLSDLKNEAKPVIDVFSFAGKVVSRNNSNAVVNTLVDLLIARIFSKSNFFVWLIFPTLLSNLSSHLVPKLIPAIKQLAAKSRGSSKEHEATREDEEFIPTLVHENGHKEKVLE